MSERELELEREEAWRDVRGGLQGGGEARYGKPS